MADEVLTAFLSAGGSLTAVSAANPLPTTGGGGGGSTTVTLAAGTANAGTFALATGGTVALAAGTANIGSVSQEPVVPTAATATAITTGGTATVLATGPWKGGFIQNPLSAADQNIAAAENLFINLVTTATANGRGSNVALYPGDSFDLPPVSAGVTLSAIAATTAHAASIELFV